MECVCGVCVYVDRPCFLGQRIDRCSPQVRRGCALHACMCVYACGPALPP